MDQLRFDMTPTYDLPNDVFNTFLCYICKGYLSCGPVKEENGNLVCGRCNSDNSNTGVQIAFEKILKNFSFPCKYDKQGCNTRVLFNSSIRHETSCIYRTLCCPVKSCTSSLRFSEFYNHFAKEHENFILYDGSFKLNIADNSNCNFLMIKDDVAAVIKYSYDACEKSLQLNVESFPIDNKLIKYKIQIVNESDCSNSVSLSEQQCSVYEISEIGQDRTMLDVTKYLFVLNNPPVLIIKVDLITSIVDCMDICTYNQNHSVSEVLHDNLEEKMLIELQQIETYRCVNCYCYPCALCDDRCKTPSNRKSKLPINVPCPWRGCSFLGTSTNLSQHISNCEFRTRICPYYSICPIGSFKFNELSIEHLKTHGIHCPNPEKICIKLFNENKLSSEISYFTIVSDEIITISVKIVKDDEWYVRSSLPKDITVDFFLTHDHCRYFSERCSYSGHMYVGTNCQPSGPLCFKECYRYMGNISVKKLKNT